MGPEFHQTHMGRQFYEQTMPMLVQELRELKEAVKELTQMVKTGIDSDAAIKEQPKSW